MSRRQIVRTGVISNLVGLIGKKGLAILIAVLLIKGLSVENYGKFSLFVASVVMLGSVSLGMDKIVQRFFPQIYNDNHDMAVSFFIIFYLKRLFVLSAFLLLGGFLVAIEVIDASRFDFDNLRIIVAFAVVFASSIMFQATLNSTFYEHKYINFAFIAGDIAKVVVLFSVWKGDLVPAMIIWGCGDVLVCILLAVRWCIKVRPNITNVWKKTSSYKYAYKRYYDYGKYMIFSSAGTFILSAEVDYYFLSYYIDNVAVGHYAFAAKIPFLMLGIVPSALMFNVLLPILFKEADSGSDLKNVSGTLVTFLKLNLVFWSVSIVFLAVNIRPIIYYIFDEKYLDTIPIIFVWFFLLFALVIKNIFEPVARAIEYTVIYLFTALAAIVNLIGNVLLVPEYGVNGALFATGLSLSIQGYAMSIFVARKIGMPLNYLVIFKFVLRLIMLALFILSLNEYSAGYSNLQLMACNIIAGLLLVSLFWPTKIFSDNELAFIVNYLHTRKPKT